MRIIVKMPGNKVFNITVQPNTPMIDVKKKIREMEGGNLTPERILIFANNMILEDDYKTIGAYGVNNDDTITLDIINDDKNDKDNEKK